MFKNGNGAIVVPKTEKAIKTLKEVHDKKADLTMQPLYRVRYFAKSLNLANYIAGHSDEMVAEGLSNSPLLRRGIKEGIFKISNSKETYYIKKDLDGNVIGRSKTIIDGENSVFVDNILIVNVPRTALGKSMVDMVIRDGISLQGAKYNVLSWTPGSSRQGTLLFAAAPDKEIQELQNSIGGGVLLKEFENQFNNKKKLAKLGTRMGQFGAPALLGAKIGWKQRTGFLLILDKIEGSEDAPGIDRQLYDGQGFYRADLTREILNTAAGKIVWSEKEAARVALQSRSNKVYSKVCADTYDRQTFKVLIDNFMAKYNYKIFGDPSNIVAAFDLNAAKVVNIDFLEEDLNINKNSMDVYVLDIAKEHRCKTSSQLLNKFGNTDTIAILEWIKEKKEKEIINFINESAEGNGSLFDDEMYAPNVIWNIACRDDAPDELFEKIAKDEMLVNILANLITKKLNSDISGFRIKLEKSSSLTALFDPTYLLSGHTTDKVLGVTAEGRVEYFCADHRGVSEANKVMGIKYPAPGLFDSERFQRVSLEQIEARLKTLLTNNEIDEVAYTAILSKYKTASFGVAYLAPINHIKPKLAGMDTDYDSIAMIWEPTIVGYQEEIFVKAAKEKGIEGPWSGPIPNIEY